MQLIPKPSLTLSQQTVATLVLSGLEGLSVSFYM